MLTLSIKFLRKIADSILARLDIEHVLVDSSYTLLVVRHLCLLRVELERRDVILT